MQLHVLKNVKDKNEPICVQSFTLIRNWVCFLKLKTSEEITIQVNEILYLFKDSESIGTDFLIGFTI